MRRIALIVLLALRMIVISCASTLADSSAGTVTSASPEVSGPHRVGSDVDSRRGWAFRPVRPGPVPAKRGAWIRNPIDAFILAGMDGKKLKPNAAADRRTLLRRATFDLIGLPPTPEELEAFERDRTSEAWSRVLARLLDDPRHGERWARHWLDVARFAESSGFEHDYDRPSAYHFRDFVIKALNSDMPYDQFVRWQVAGDEFEPGNPLALMATGFLGAGVFPTQITANEVERTRYDAMDDMLSTTGTAILGLTVGCARCHDHKFDPISSTDYYRMLSTFTTTVRSEVELDLQPELNRRRQGEFEAAHAPLVALLNEHETKKLPARFDAWLVQGAPVPSASVWQILEASELRSKSGATFRRLVDGSYLVEGPNADSDTYTFTAEVHDRGLRGLRLEALSDASFPKGGPGRAPNGNIGLSRIRVLASPLRGGATNEVVLVRPRATFEQNLGSLSIASALDADPRTGWAVDPRFGTNHAAAFEFRDVIDHDGGTRLVVLLEFGLNAQHNIGRPRFAVTTAVNPGLGEGGIPADVSSYLARVRNADPVERALSVAERARLLEWWKPTDPEWRSLKDRVDSHALQAPKPNLSKVMICAEGYPALRMHTQGGDFFNETYYLLRGSTELKRGVATQDFLGVLKSGSAAVNPWREEPAAGSRFSGRRRALAKWLTDTHGGAGELVARVIVNRLWQHHFGVGLVATPNDFGVQGAKPTHPELLDWLASELIRGGWRLKPIHQLIMNSSTYRQSSVADSAKLRADPSNALLSRYTPRRLEAEAIRDSLLFVSGALDPTMYGPGTLDAASRRRSVYFTVKRSQLIPAMQTFDAPEPLVSQGTRPTTTVAPQALWLMNNPHVRAWCAACASRVDTDPSRSMREVIVRAYRVALNREPTSAERADALEFLERQTQRYAGESGGRSRALALTDLAQVILSLNEFLYVD